MDLKDFPFFDETVLTLSSSDNLDQLVEGQKVAIQKYGDDWLLVQNDQRVKVRPTANNRGNFELLVERDQTQWLLTKATKGKLLLRYCAPVELQFLDIEVGIDELIIDDLYSKQEIPTQDPIKASAWFAKTFIVDAANSQWLVVANHVNHAKAGAFQLLGNGWRADIEETDDAKLLVKRLTRRIKRDGGFALIIGTFSFVDASVAQALQSGTEKAMLDAALRSNQGYLDLWNLYNSKEWDQALDQASTLRTLRITEIEGRQEGRTNYWKLTPRTLDDLKEFKERWQVLELESNQQYDLGTNPPDFTEELAVTALQAGERQVPRGTIRFRPDHVEFRPASTGQHSQLRQQDGWLYLSLAGHRTAGKRRLAAKQTIDSGKRLTQLKWLLEGVAVPPSRRRKIKALTPYAKETFKGGKPTAKQENALEVALNTPDLAIIIGPPGTGKTQVIAALQRRLAEESQEQSLSGQVLISSFQHDAVDNALDRSDVMGLPGTRIGGKRGSADQTALLEPWIAQRVDYLNDQVAAEYEKHSELKLINNLADRLAMVRLAGYQQNRLADELEKCLEDIRALLNNGISVNSELEFELEDYISELRSKGGAQAASIEQADKLVKKIRAMRITAESFADDGSERAWDLYSTLKRTNHNVEPGLLAVLEDLAESSSDNIESFDGLAQLKHQLLDKFLPDYRPPALKQKIDDQGLALISKLEIQVEKLVQKSKQGAAWVLEQLVASLSQDQRATKSVIDEYSMVVGATCQQAAGKQMASLKEIAGFDSTEIEFETVVVDEAARANPLDLFVPMAMAKRRIILVGDDRQLPHMLEPSIEEALQQELNLTDQQQEAFRSSLFERLRIKLQELQKQDGVDRVIMLDTQFRMHPVLGDFVSQQFYESEGLGKVHSGRSAEDFAFSESFLTNIAAQKGNYEDKVCQWIDVADANNPARRNNGKSLSREAEADVIVNEVQQLLAAGGEAMSVGVITFYAAQRELIMQKLAERKVNNTPLMVKTDQGYEPHDDFKWTKKTNKDGSITREERLRVGSVDAFQGKEFDVVLLSVVRTFNAKKPASEPGISEEEKEKRLRSQFGFMRLTNRMNVAMSRQRQMLICVGDAQLAQGQDAQTAVPSLAAFYQLCKGDHGAIRSY
ncbi:DEAD/DEAH box helicase [Salinibius halmophilus]|uniref:DEAD/DEAH box helicase n=1 Tax=Salinibius halmophilus TaxID=1853216 RepID=UPI000E670EF7|nr:AAA domain-containing protein [Salinibius halmophilus]